MKESVPAFTLPLSSTLVDETPTVERLQQDIASIIRTLHRINREKIIAFDRPLSAWTLMELTK